VTPFQSLGLAAAPARVPQSEEASPSPKRIPLKSRRIKLRLNLGRTIFTLLALAATAAGALCGLLLVFAIDLPQIDDLTRYRPSTITQLYDAQGREIGSFALHRRVIAGYDDYPQVLREAIFSIEDKEFEQHAGVDFWRIFGAAYRDITRGRMQQGASTLTMQLSRNLFLSPDRSWKRKVQEAVLALQIERRFTKQQIFTLYANEIFLGHGVYGFEAGAQFYFGKHARELTLPEAALLAGLPKGPSSYSPLNFPERALRRRNLVIDNLLEDGKITADQAIKAKATALKLNIQSGSQTLAPYYVEEIRQYLERKYGSAQVHEAGLRVYTTLNFELQRAANLAVLDGLAAYERRHGWKGAVRNVLSGKSAAEASNELDEYDHPDWDAPIAPGFYLHALVISSSTAGAELKIGRYRATLSPADIKWTGHSSPIELLKRGDLLYVKVLEVHPARTASEHDKLIVSLEQESGVQGALLAIDNATGDILAMVGGRDFRQSKFDRATQALRQVGSSFKPYVYTAAIDQGATPDDVVLDAPTTFLTQSGAYTPHNFDGRFEGRITLRRALAQSRNIPALKEAQAIGIRSVIDYAHRFGITSNLPPYLPVALGAAEVTLLEQTSAYSTFPNDGIRITPRFLRKVTDRDGHVLEENIPAAHDVISARTARVMVSMLREVVQHGTGARAAELGVPLAGKTGTTNDFTDAWFIGFSPSITCGVWIGFDEKKTLGDKETGAAAALPMWIDFMRVAIASRPAEDFIAAPVLAPAAQKLDTPDRARGVGETH
jgi:penicillin-binding protein 1A